MVTVGCVFVSMCMRELAYAVTGRPKVVLVLGWSGLYETYIGLYS